MAIIGLINIPIVKFSVDIWYSLHQPASILKIGDLPSTIYAFTFYYVGSFIMYFVFVLLIRTRIVMDKIKNNKSTMTYVVTDECVKCKYTDCVEVCPVDCFYEGELMLVINPG